MTENVADRPLPDARHVPLMTLVHEGTGLDRDRRRDAEAVIERMVAKFGYCRNCAGDAASMLVRKRFHDLVV